MDGAIVARGFTLGDQAAADEVAQGLKKSNASITRWMRFTQHVAALDMRALMAHDVVEVSAIERRCEVRGDDDQRRDEAGGNREITPRDTTTFGPSSGAGTALRTIRVIRA